jgi:NAD(P)-dependent dehydrogenase (short-subunit alcohol dehydrogenase family)
MRAANYENQLSKEVLVVVVVCDMLEKEGQQTVQEIEAKHGQDRAFFHKIDVSKEAEGRHGEHGLLDVRAQR